MSGGQPTVVEIPSTTVVIVVRDAVGDGVVVVMALALAGGDCGGVVVEVAVTWGEGGGVFDGLEGGEEEVEEIVEEDSCVCEVFEVVVDEDVVDEDEVEVDVEVEVVVEVVTTSATEVVVLVDDNESEVDVVELVDTSELVPLADTLSVPVSVPLGVPARLKEDLHLSSRISSTYKTFTHLRKATPRASRRRYRRYRYSGNFPYRLHPVQVIVFHE